MEGGYLIRWMLRRDLADVMLHEQARWTRPWSEEEFLSILRDNYTIGMVIERDDEIVGFMIYELHSACFKILNFCCHPDHPGVRETMLYKLQSKLRIYRATCLMWDGVSVRIPDGNRLFVRRGELSATLEREIKCMPAAQRWDRLLDEDYQVWRKMTKK